MSAAIELHLLDRRYAGLRAVDVGRQARLVAAISAEGQRTPVLVVRGESGTVVLIDGFARVAALETLGRDVVDAAVLDLAEADALALGHRMETARRRTALEEGWLILALIEVHGKRPKDLALSFQKTPSWVSRRLALVRSLPESVQDAVRKGRISVHGAEKYLVPLARANSLHCARLVERLGETRPTVRQLGRVWAAWRSADAETRTRIVENPVLYLAVEEELVTAVDEEDLDVLADVEAIAGMCGRTRKHLRDGSLDRLPSGRRPALDGAWKEAQLAFDAVRALFIEGGLGARR